MRLVEASWAIFADLCYSSDEIDALYEAKAVA